MHDGLRERIRHVVREPGADAIDLRELARLVDAPELGEATHLALVVAPGPCERGERRSRHVRRMDLDERVDQIVPEATA